MNKKSNTRSVKRISMNRNPTAKEEGLPCNDPGNCVELSSSVPKEEGIVPEVCPGGRCSIQRPSRRASRARGRRSAGSASNRRRRRSKKSNARNRRHKKSAK